MQKSWALWLASLLLLPVMCFADDYVVGKDYRLVAHPQKPSAGAAPKVVEFFSYGCPACNSLEPTVEDWLASKPKNIQFSRVPVTFHPQWYILAKAYYTAKALNVESTLSPKIFAALHDQNVDLSTPAKMKKFFVDNGVSAQSFDSMFDFAPGIEAQIAHGDDLLRRYQLNAVPTFVVNGTYQTDMSMAGSAKRFQAILNYLAEKN